MQNPCKEFHMLLKYLPKRIFSLTITKYRTKHNSIPSIHVQV
uniref:Uncharacterized protein n=1 Tax=Anguilla anguilla TaxID=7936 RepID=A0A0E9Q2B5_ANGAN